MTYPQALHLSDTVHDDGDPLLNAWALVWVAHQLPIAPAHIFDANAFYPGGGRWRSRGNDGSGSRGGAGCAGRVPARLFVYNVVFRSASSSPGAGVAVLVRRAMTGSGGAGVVAGIVFAFASSSHRSLPTCLLQTQCLPFIFWASQPAAADEPPARRRRVFGALAAGPGPAVHVLRAVSDALRHVRARGAAAGRSGPRRSSGCRRFWPRPRLAIVAVAPVGIVYSPRRRQVVGERTAAEVANGSAMPRETILALPKSACSTDTCCGVPLTANGDSFSGSVTLALGACAHGRAVNRRPRRLGSPGRFRPLAGGAQIIRALSLRAPDFSRVRPGSLGFNGLTYRLPLRLRGAAPGPADSGAHGHHHGVFAGGPGRIWRGATRRRPEVGVRGALRAHILLACASKPLDLRRIPIGGARELRGHDEKDRGDGPTAAVPRVPASPRGHDDPTYMYCSTFHWQHLINLAAAVSSRRRISGPQRDDTPFRTRRPSARSCGARLPGSCARSCMASDCSVRFTGCRLELAKRPDLMVVPRRPAAGPDGHEEISLLSDRAPENEILEV